MKEQKKTFWTIDTHKGVTTIFEHEPGKPARKLTQEENDTFLFRMYSKGVFSR